MLDFVSMHDTQQTQIGHFLGLAAHSPHSCRWRWSNIRRQCTEQAHTRLLPCSAAPTLKRPGSLYRTILKEETTKRQSLLFAFLTPMPCAQQSLREHLLVRKKANKILLTFTLICNVGHQVMPNYISISVSQMPNLGLIDIRSLHHIMFLSTQ